MKSKTETKTYPPQQKSHRGTFQLLSKFESDINLDHPLLSRADSPHLIERINPTPSLVCPRISFTRSRAERAKIM